MSKNIKDTGNNPSRIFTQKLEHISIYLVKKEKYAADVEAIVAVAQPGGSGEKIKSEAGKIFRDIFIQSIEKSYQKDLKEPDFDKKQVTRSKRTYKRHPDLKDYFRTNRYLIATYKGKTYKADLIKSSGQIKYKNQIYKSPSAAAKAVTQKEAVNGWDFWCVEDSSGKLTKLSDLG